jgi:thiol-disulfide isomerase/thioredoxin
MLRNGDSGRARYNAAMAKHRDPTLYYVLAFGLLVVGLTAAQSYFDKRGGVGTGQAAPDFEVRRLDGDSVRLASMRGHVVLVDFWARWCKPCVTMMPALERVAKRFEGRPFKLLSVNIEAAPPNQIRAWLNARGVRDVVAAQDPSGAAQVAYRVSSIPRLVLVDAKGVVRAFFGAGARESQLVTAIEDALEKT